MCEFVLLDLRVFGAIDGSGRYYNVLFYWFKRLCDEIFEILGSSVFDGLRIVDTSANLFCLRLWIIFVLIQSQR